MAQKALPRTYNIKINMNFLVNLRGQSLLDDIIIIFFRIRLLEFIKLYLLGVTWDQQTNPEGYILIMECIGAIQK